MEKKERKNSINNKMIVKVNSISNPTDSQVQNISKIHWTINQTNTNRYVDLFYWNLMQLGWKVISFFLKGYKEFFWNNNGFEGGK